MQARRGTKTKSQGKSKWPAAEWFGLSENRKIEEMKSDRIPSLGDVGFRGLSVQERRWSLRKRGNRKPPVLLLSPDSGEVGENSADEDSGGNKSQTNGADLFPFKGGVRLPSGAFD